MITMVNMFCRRYIELRVFLTIANSNSKNLFSLFETSLLMCFVFPNHFFVGKCDINWLSPPFIAKIQIVIKFLFLSRKGQILLKLKYGIDEYLFLLIV